MGKRGIRSKKGQSESSWGEPKTVQMTVQLTKTGAESVINRAKRLGISRAEVLERWGRNIAVDDDSATRPPVDVDFETVLKALSRFSRRQIGQLIRIATELLLKAEPLKDEDEDEAKQRPEQVQTISDLINLWGNLEDLADKSRIKLPSLERYRDGDCPTDTDLVKLGGLLKKPDGTILRTADLQQIRDRTFPNSVNREPTNGSI